MKTRRQSQLAREADAEAIAIVGSKGGYLIGARGKRFIDFTSGFCVGNFGWNDRTIVAALRNFKGPTYVYPDYRGLDWDAIRDEFAPRIAAAEDSEAFYALLRELIERLGDQHSRFESPREVAEEQAEFRGDLLPEYTAKIAGQATRIERLRIDGERAIWLEGAPHFFFYRPPGQTFREERLRLAQNVLLLEHGRLLVRLEGAFDLDKARELARSLG